MSEQMQSQQIKKVISRFDSVMSQASGVGVSMGECFVDESCGTPMCHGGWYAAACMMDEDHYISNCDYVIDFSDGADVMARDLGFDNQFDLTEWAYENEDMWGNDCGEDMFCSHLAFDSGAASITMKVIRNHWAKVHNRMHPESEPILLLPPLE